VLNLVLAGTRWLYRPISIAARLGAMAVCPAIITPVVAAETKSYVVSWFVMASNAYDGDCPDGLNLDVEQHQRHVLAQLGKSEQEIDALAGNVGGLAKIIQHRGKINGEPVYIYTNPASLPDPKIKLLKGKQSVGFNLDGKEREADFADPITKDRGVDNMAYRALGCYDAQRAPLGHRASFGSSTWDTSRNAMPAWLIEITGIDDLVNDPAVEVGIYQAAEPMARNPATGDAQPDMTYRVLNNPRVKNKAIGRIANGQLITEPFALYMLGDLMYMPEYEFQQARLRLPILPSGPDQMVSGVLGGYQPWKTVYWGICGLTALFCETTHSYDPTGIYYALSQLADAHPDPSTGKNTHISVSYMLEATPAFTVHDIEAAKEPSR
jgi:hypothetical protein